MAANLDKKNEHPWLEVKEVKAMPTRLTLIVCFALTTIFLAVIPPHAQAVGVEIGPFELELRPGDKYLGSISVSNDKEEAVSLKIYLGDWKQTDYGEQYLEVGMEPHSLSKWMRISPSRVIIPPYGSEEIYFEIKVPEDAELSGSYWGIFFVEEEAKPTEFERKRGNHPTFDFNIVVRHGIKVYLTIPGSEQRKALFTDAWTDEPDEGVLDFIGTFKNQGNTYLRPEVWLELRNLNGETVFTQNHSTLSILPGIKRDYKFELRELNLPPGRYIGLIIADYGVASLIAAQAEIEVKGS